jgi:hypothetical protein
LYPPVETDRFSFSSISTIPRVRGMSVGQGGVKSTTIPQPLPPSQGGKGEDYYIIISALSEFKKIEVAIE